MALLFEDQFKRLTSELKKKADIELSRAIAKTNFDISKWISPDFITGGFVHAISTGNWHPAPLQDGAPGRHAGTLAALIFVLARPHDAHPEPV
jgi:DNA-directed RNA polymerase beta subunit